VNTCTECGQPFETGETVYQVRRGVGVRGRVHSRGGRWILPLDCLPEEIGNEGLAGYAEQID